MLWTLDSLRGDSAALVTDVDRVEQHEHPLSALFWRLDVMIYAAALGFAACIASMLFG